MSMAMEPKATTAKAIRAILPTANKNRAEVRKKHDGQYGKTHKYNHGCQPIIIPSSPCHSQQNTAIPVPKLR